MKAPKRKRLSKDEIKINLYKPTGDYFLEKMDAWTYKIHLTSKDASNIPNSFWGKFEVENAGKGHYGS